MIELLKIDNIMYRVSDLKKAEKFYSDVLGLKKVWEDKNAKMVGFAFKNSDSEIVIHANSDLPKFDFSFLVDDVAQFCKEVTQKGVRIASGPLEVRPGKYAVLLDPDGNEVPVIDLSKYGNKPRYNTGE